MTSFTNPTLRPDFAAEALVGGILVVAVLIISHEVRAL
jgi:hypothetical protein